MSVPDPAVPDSTFSPDASSLVSKILEDGDINQVLSKLETAALDDILEENYVGALTYLKKREELLESLTTEGLSPDRDEVLSTLTNTACCYQRCPPGRLGLLDKCAAYLEACTIYTVNTTVAQLKPKALTDVLKRSKLQCLIHIQLCAILSQLGNHSEALVKAKSAARLAHFAIECTARVHKLHLASYSLLKERREKVSEAMQQTHLLAARATPMLKSLQETLKSSDLPLSEDQHVMRSVLGVKAFPDWVTQLSISDMMLIQPLATEDLKQKSSIRVEFSKDFMIYKAANVAVAYFCISTELLFLRGKQAYNPARDKPT